MRKKIICAVLLAAAAAFAQAEETTWQYTYQGFVDTATGVFNPRVTLTGSFTGSDKNADGYITTDELTKFVSSSIVYLAPYPAYDPPYLEGEGGCARSWSSYRRCEIKEFSYKLTGELEYSVEQWGNDEGSRSWYRHEITGDHFRDGGGDYMTEIYYETRYNWSELTEFSITPAPVALPVPEPSAALLLPAGLAVLAAARRRRSKVAL